ncbi:uncharacterized protein BCR38DRAFT_412558 [Pseudomassariella vexata]|uniref:Uncharacterized protein n=1 Tax=Pseudomassariella vexata TaxID=1141098 RepID=A0A1Y2DJX4_9PEZI|nr:uncharacterized protein BCR38DRAFT_412558 [Pseudomassariella vexata]ORY59547.1 hypothetical protein BCR38DRAFT_412558 [Pseudomassariella vexata]
MNAIAHHSGGGGARNRYLIQLPPSGTAMLPRGARFGSSTLPGWSIPPQGPFFVPPPPPPLYGGPPTGGYAGGVFYQAGIQPTSPPPTNAPRRDRPVEVVTDGGVFHCSRDDILYHLPNARYHSLGRHFFPKNFIATPNRAASTLDALRHIFRGLENYRNTGQPFELFERADSILDKAKDGRYGFAEAARFYIGVCNALDKECGLGCSDELLVQIDDFVVGLMEMVDNQVQPTYIREILFAYARVFQPSTPRHMETLRTLWGQIPDSLKPMLVGEINKCATAQPKSVVCQAFARAMKDMCFV